MELKLKLRSFKSSEHFNEKGDVSYSGFGYLSLISDTLDLELGAKENYCTFSTFNGVGDTKTSIIQNGPNV